MSTNVLQVGVITCEFGEEEVKITAIGTMEIGEERTFIPVHNGFVIDGIIKEENGIVKENRR